MTNDNAGKRAASAPLAGRVMGKQRHENRQEAKATEQETAAKPRGPSRVPWFQQCPSCYGGRGGVGIERWHRRINGVLMKKCYQCNVCGFDWTATVRTVTEGVNVQYHDADVDHRDVDLETR